jgi:phosphoribosyl 1,2-cyclic phosphodiesterase
MDIMIHHSGSAGNLYQVDDLLIEAGVSVGEIKRCLNFRLSDISACLVSHFHGDHAKGAAGVLKAGVDVYCSKETAEALNLSGHRLHFLEAEKQIRVGEWSIRPFRVVHDAPGSLGFLIAKGDEKLLFATDTTYIKPRFAGLTHIMLGVDYDKEILNDKVWKGALHKAVASRTATNHMCLQTAKKFFEANWQENEKTVREIYLLHLSDTNSDEVKFREEIERLTGRPVYLASGSPLPPPSGEAPGPSDQPSFPAARSNPATSAAGHSWD